MRSGFLGKLLDRIRRVSPEEVQNYLEELAREKGFLETIFNSLQEGIFVTDLHGQIIYVNRAACAMFGLNAERSLGKPIQAEVRGLDWDAVSHADSTTVREMEVFYPESRFLNFYVEPLKGEDGSSEGLAIILRDVTQARKSTEATIESERFSALTMLAAGVAHEIGNPLNSLHIHLGLAERKLKQMPSAKAKPALESVQIAKDEVARLDLIITQFLRAIRPTPLETRMENLNLLIEECLQFLNAELRDRDILVERDLDTSLPMLPIDAGQIKQAVYNIIRNAVQAMKPGGFLRIRTGADESHVFASFSDTGGGIAPEHMSRLFEPYFTTKKSGSGLGLLIVRRIVREHGGEVMIESNPGKGLALTIRLPRIDRRVRLLPQGS